MLIILTSLALVLTLTSGTISIIQIIKDNKHRALIFAMCTLVLIGGTIYVARLSSPITNFNPTQPSSTPTSSAYVQLHQSYSGTATGYAEATVTFKLNSEDQQGNVSMTTTFQQLTGAKNFASYNCTGTVSSDGKLTLQCTNPNATMYVLAIQAQVYSDGHMQGTEVATDTDDPTYNHVYNWEAF